MFPVFCLQTWETEDVTTGQLTGVYHIRQSLQAMSTTIQIHQTTLLTDKIKGKSYWYTADRKMTQESDQVMELFSQNMTCKKTSSFSGGRLEWLKICNIFYETPWQLLLQDNLARITRGLSVYWLMGWNWAMTLFLKIINWPSLLNSIYDKLRFILYSGRGSWYNLAFKSAQRLKQYIVWQ